MDVGWKPPTGQSCASERVEGKHMRFDSGFMETSEKKMLSDLKSEKMKIFLTVFEGHLPICQTLSSKHSWTRES